MIYQSIRKLQVILSLGNQIHIISAYKATLIYISLYPNICKNKVYQWYINLLKKKVQKKISTDKKSRDKSKNLSDNQRKNLNKNRSETLGEKSKMIKGRSNCCKSETFFATFLHHISLDFIKFLTCSVTFHLVVKWFLVLYVMHHLVKLKLIVY